MFAHVHIDVSSEQFQLHSDLIYISAILYSPSATLYLLWPFILQMRNIAACTREHKEAKEQEKEEKKQENENERKTTDIGVLVTRIY